MTAALGAAFPEKTDGLLFLDETGTGNYFNARDLARYDAAQAAGRKAPFPTLFGLAGAFFRRDDYLAFDKAFKALKKKHLGAHIIPLHEYDVRRLRTGPFKVFRDPLRWRAFYADLSALISATPVEIYVVTFDKPAMQRQYQSPFHPYHYALEIILERVVIERPNWGTTCRVVAEDREAGLNDQLSRELLHLQLVGGGRGISKSRNTVSAEDMRATFDSKIVFRKKPQNDSGLQIADLAAGPITRHIYGLDASEPRTVTRIVEAKLCTSSTGRVRGFGVMCFPQGIPTNNPYR